MGCDDRPAEGCHAKVYYAGMFVTYNCVHAAIRNKLNQLGHGYGWVSCRQTPTM